MKKGIAFLVAAILGVTSGIIAAYFFQIIEAGDAGMSPTIELNDKVLVSTHAYTSKSPSTADLVLVDTSSWVHGQGGEGSKSIKRLIGCPGDRVAIFDGVVYINGYALSEEYLQTDASSGSFDAVQLSEDEYFILGDNRQISTDSRNQGAGVISKKQILGEVIIW